MKPQKGDDPKGRRLPTPTPHVYATATMMQTAVLLSARVIRDHDIDRLTDALRAVSISEGAQ